MSSLPHNYIYLHLLLLRLNLVVILLETVNIPDLLFLEMINFTQGYLTDQMTVYVGSRSE